MSMILKIGAAEYSLRVITPTGKQTFDFSKMSKVQLEGAREMVVNYWCREHGFPPSYTNV